MDGYEPTEEEAEIIESVNALDRQLRLALVLEVLLLIAYFSR